MPTLPQQQPKCVILSLSLSRNVRDVCYAMDPYVIFCYNPTKPFIYGSFSLRAPANTLCLFFWLNSSACWPVCSTLCPIEEARQSVPSCDAGICLMECKECVQKDVLPLPQVSIPPVCLAGGHIMRAANKGEGQVGRAATSLGEHIVCHLF